MSAWFCAFLAGTAAGILSGCGVGGGTLLLVYLTAVSGVDQYLARGINLLYFLPAAAAALLGHVKNGYVDQHAALPAICAGLAAAALSAWVSCSLSGALLRRYFGVFLIVAGCCELVRSFRK